MPHPTPAQLFYGSVTVVALTLALLLLAPSAPGPVLGAAAAVALLTGAAVGAAVPGRRASGRAKAPARPREAERRRGAGV